MTAEATAAAAATDGDDGRDADVTWLVTNETVNRE